MDKLKAKKRISFLTDVLNEHSNRYYQQNEPIIPDQEFDDLLNELQDLESQFPSFKLAHSPTTRVGGETTKGFDSLSHQYPMLSLGNTYSIEELKAFDERVKKRLETTNYTYVCELKFDGVAVCLRYENGILTKGITRGDGTKGDDVTTNIKTIKMIPLKTLPVDQPEQYEVRGEVFMPKLVFEQLNKEKKDLGEALLANPRNTASGTLKMQNSSVVATRNLSCYMYSYLDDYETFSTHLEAIHFLENVGFHVSPTFQKCNDIHEVIQYIRKWENKRHEMEVETDGVVIKVNDLQQQKKLGFTAKNPRWAIAYKYKTEHAKTQLLGIHYQVGRTGAVTPVAELKPVSLAGTTVKRASLHNKNEILRLGLQVGDTVFVEKGGEIIPKITGVDVHTHARPTAHFEFPQQCPECNAHLIRYEGEALHYCPNQANCQPQVLGRIEHFVSRGAMDIATLGPRTLKGLLKYGLIKHFADLYSLKYEQIVGLQIQEFNSKTRQTVKRSIQEKSAQNIIQSIQISKNTPFERVIFALGIRFVGKTVAEKLAHYFMNLDNLMDASLDEIRSVSDIGERIAKSLMAYFKNKDNLDILLALKKSGLQMQVTQKIPIGNTLKENTFVISGTFQNYDRDEIKELIKNNGGQVVAALSAKTNYLIAGQNMGPAKKQKANSLNILIISEDELIKMIQT